MTTSYELRLIRIDPDLASGTLEVLVASQGDAETVLASLPHVGRRLGADAVSVEAALDHPADVPDASPAEADEGEQRAKRKRRTKAEIAADEAAEREAAEREVAQAPVDDPERAAALTSEPTPMTGAGMPSASAVAVGPVPAPGEGASLDLTPPASAPTPNNPPGVAYNPFAS